MSLYLIEILHQTTTKDLLGAGGSRLYLIEILHQTTTTAGEVAHFSSCILSKFYIKPQLRGRPLLLLGVVSYRNSTSNHNSPGNGCLFRALYLIEILHQTTTYLAQMFSTTRCILSKFYIKPQHFDSSKRINYSCILSKFYIKPQLPLFDMTLRWRCILSKFYIKPQLVRNFYGYSQCCILSKFYIKPQLSWSKANHYCVVSYRNSTSNHNGGSRYSDWLEVVSYRNSTSNHNFA